MFNFLRNGKTFSNAPESNIPQKIHMRVPGVPLPPTSPLLYLVVSDILTF